MGDRKTSYCVIKKMTLANGRLQHVILVDGHSEIMEWNDKVEVERVVELLNSNTDSGHTYILKEI